jgi:hypothetical protein
MIATNNQNHFLVELLTLQQDGKRSISAPTNWTTQEPLIEVPTEIDDIVNDLCTTILRGIDSKSVGRWHFFIGSPGNGKSAAIGKLCRQLMADHDCEVRDEDGCSIGDLNPTAVPYALDIYEGANKYASARVVQDASVVRNPFASDLDPAAELLSTLREAWDKGISLIVCTNRGVIEKAHSDNHVNRDVNTTPWFKVLATLVSGEITLNGDLGRELTFSGHKPVFNIVKTTYSCLDNRSLVIRSDTYDRLVQKAIDPVHWTICLTCAVSKLCPFKANRDWLSNSEAKQKVLTVLARAEAFSGQIIVFREALALISLILSGCPRDYGDIHPCEWVADRASRDDIFSLAARRIYMSLFASHSPFGLESNNILRKREIDALRVLQGLVDDEHPEIKAALMHVLAGPPPSTDVGVTRLLDEGGVISQIDPWCESLPAGFYDSWDGDFDAVGSQDDQLVTNIERRCLETWAFLEQMIESTSGHVVSESHWALRRWSSNYLLHLGALMDGRTAWSRELDDFLIVLDLVHHNPDDRTTEQKRALRGLNEKLEKLIDIADTEKSGSGAIQLSDGVSLTGRWVNDKLKPNIVASKESSALSLAVQFEKKEWAQLTALTFLWLSRGARGHLTRHCFPSDLLRGVLDARIRAAARSGYALADDDVEIEVKTDKSEIFRLERFDGDVAVDLDMEEKHG